VPLDEALINVVVDLSGRPFFAYDIKTKQSRIGSFDVELIHDFLLAFVNENGMNLHVRMLAGRNPAPHRRGDLQGHGARARPRHPTRSARAGRALDQGNALRMNGWPIVGWATLAVAAIVAAIFAVAGHGRGGSAWRSGRPRGPSRRVLHCRVRGVGAAASLAERRDGVAPPQPPPARVSFAASHSSTCC
jgi:hypothetical protein